MSALQDLLDHYRANSKSERDKGDKFERLTKFFLENDSRFSDRFSDVWIWNNFPENEGKVDTGIDLVAKEKYLDGYCAIQCKFYGENNVIDKPHIDSFFTASGKSIYTSRLIFATTDKWTKHAEDALADQKVPVNRVTTDDMEDGSIDWEQFNSDSFTAPQRRKKGIREHQKKALDNVMKGFESSPRGYMVMACGTGKTFTSLKIAEEINGTILFLAPSISLISQTFNEWIAQSNKPIGSIIICSDISIKAEENDDIHTYDLACPPTTNPDLLIKTAKAEFTKDKLNVIFSTYQSIQVVIDAQERGLADFDLVVCDEAHRTTGVTLSDREDSHFTKVHDETRLKSKRRLYMTATPKIYAENMAKRAKEEDAEVFSMDDESVFGPRFHYLGFGESVEKGLLSDYKVMVLGVEEEYAKKFFQKDNELQIDDDQIKIIGCWNGLAKRLVNDGSNEGNPMRRAVAFSRSIKDSKRFTDLFSKTVTSFIQKTGQEGELLDCQVDHVDGTMNSLERQTKLKWLKADTSSDGNICRILSNARCLSEGVDVPTLDAVLFLNPRNSIVDVVQSVGRAMRKAEGKQYGYIIIPISIPANVEPEKALNDNERYKIVWDVCQALRAHDDRFEATVNKIKFNVKKPEQIDVTIIGEGGKGASPQGMSGGKEPTVGAPVATQLKLDLTTAEEWQNAILGKIAKKCGSRDYWENWAKDVSVIAEGHIERIKKLLSSSDEEHKKAFEQFVKGLRKNLNPSVSEEDAIEMLAQHLITKPVFDALFEGYEFAKNNPVSKSFKKMLDLLEDQTFEKDQKVLEDFYDSVRKKVSNIDNAAAKQSIIKELYDKFFNLAFPKMAERLGIVYTPIEVVDFIINSADVILKKEFNLSIADRDVHILDPFTGTGTFMVRLLQSGLIKQEDLEYKYKNDLHANEIVLLAYYIAAINIEETFHDLNEAHKYAPFDGIVLADTFQISESKGEFEEKMFPENNKRVKRQMESPIQVIIGNPPYSVGQESQNDANQNLKYSHLDSRIKETYVENSTAINKNSLYDSYFRAFRWASDRIKDRGIICFVTNGSFIDGNAADGFRKSLAAEFSSLYIFNLRGNQRTSGELSRKEGGKIFGSGSRTPVAISILVKNSSSESQCEIFYYDVGDYLTREDKLRIIAEKVSIKGIDWEKIQPNKEHDWINKRDPKFDSFIPISSRELVDVAVFQNFSAGLESNRDAWTYNFSRSNLVTKINSMVDFYNSQVDLWLSKKLTGEKNINAVIDNDHQNISWTRGLKNNLEKGKKFTFKKDEIRTSIYRPFCKQNCYFDKNFNEYVYQMPNFFPEASFKTPTISVSGRGSTVEFSALMVDQVPNRNMIGTAQCFALYTYSKKPENSQTSLLLEDASYENANYEKKINISDQIQTLFEKTYKSEISKEDIFYYVYGIFHSKEYKDRFSIDLKKMLPRIPLVKDFLIFSKAGKNLAYWHLNYESVELYNLVQDGEMSLGDPKLYEVAKMYFPKIGGREDKSTIIYNNRIKFGDIPLEAYDYVVNGKSAIEWVMERYQITVDKDSGIPNNPNSWGLERNDPEYIINLIKRVVRVSVESVKIINSLPKLDEVK